VRYEKRLQALAERHWLCPVHMTKLLCGPCDFRWVGTDAEFLEYWALFSHDDASRRRDLETTDLTCPRHPHVRLQCARCYHKAAGHVDAPGDGLTAEDVQREQALIRRFVRPARAVGAYPPGDPQYTIAEALAMLAKGIPIEGPLKDRLVPLAKEMHAWRISPRGTDDAL
jgi:hypothetical protein